ncbi:MAG: UDP-galactopyranose mutase [Akkermansiaceae bacterium]|nr:UDP-galactopyranose mutase [Armatimonadota bacterium]
MQFDYLIVGAGFAGSVLAERLASQSGKTVLIVDKRSHIGGNAYDRYDSSGILIHPYGPHIFHTNSDKIFGYLSQFTDWRAYEHRVLASVKDKNDKPVHVPIPINLTTINTLYKLNLTPDQLEIWYRGRAEKIEHCRTSEEVVVSKVGRELYEKFFRGYTRKQWDLDPSELDAQVTARIPTRTTDDDRYFNDTFQYMPLHGYTAMFEKILANPRVKVMLNTDYHEVKETIRFREMIFTGPVDEFFDYRFGKLPYRSLHFQHETHDTEKFLAAPVVNFPSEDVPYTRISEFKALTGQEHPTKTSVVYEFPRSTGDPYYPIPKADCTALYNKYKELADGMPGVHFVGRLATYKYYNMDQVVGQALATYDKIVGKREQVAPVILSAPLTEKDVLRNDLKIPVAPGRKSQPIPAQPVATRADVSFLLSGGNRQ